jgi:hypothetical protein
MTEKQYNPSMIEEGFAVVAIALSVVLSSLLRPWYSKWGATGTEVEKPLPGDEQVPHPNMENTRAITIQASADAIWPWLLQMGQGRGGLYSYERLENLMGCDMHNADRIIPEYQQMEIGDKVRLSQGDNVPYFVVTDIVPGRAIILGGDDPPTTWSFILDPIDEKSTRLIIRFRQDYEPTFGNVLSWRIFTDPINFVMERKMLQGIKARVEGSISA